MQGCRVTRLHGYHLGVVGLPVTAPRYLILGLINLLSKDGYPSRDTLVGMVYMDGYPDADLNDDTDVVG